MPYPASRAYVLLLALAACDEAPRPWSAPPRDRRLDEGGPFLPEEGAPSLLGDAGFLDPSEAEPEEIVAPSRLAGGLWAGCHQGFVPSGDPGADVTRLAMACGPANGMRRARGLLRGEVGPDQPASVAVTPEAGRCFRIFAAGDRSAGRLTLSARDARGSLLAEHSGPWAVLEPERPVCSARGFQLTLAAETRGRYALEIWSSSDAPEP